MSYSTYVHEDANDHHPEIKSNKGLILDKPMLFDQTLLDSAQEPPVQACVDEEKEDLGGTIPPAIDPDESETMLGSYIFDHSLGHLT